MTQYKLDDIKKSRLTVAVLWIVYCASYFIRACYAASIVSIVGDGVYSKGEVGLVGTAFFVCYGVGQFISGLVGDRVNPFYMIIAGSAAGAVSCFLMPLTGNLLQMLIIWAANGFFQSMLWSPILRIYSQTIDSSLQKKAVLNVSLSLPVGTVLAYLLSTFIIKHSNWRLVFVTGGVCILLAALTVTFSFLYIKKDIVKIKVAPAVKAEKEKGRNGGFISLAGMSGLFLIIVPSFLHGMMRDGITNWVPTMITESYGVSSSFSTFVTIVLPIFNAFGAYAVMPLLIKCKGDEMLTSGIIGALSLIPMTLMLFVGKIPVYALIILLALTTSVMYALNYLIISLVPVRFGKYLYTSTVSGVLNSAAHIGCAVSSYGFGAVAERFGWNAVVVIWIVAAALTAIISFAANIKWKKFIK